MTPRLAAALVLTLGCVASRPVLAADPTMAGCLAANEGAIKLRVDHKLRQAREQSLLCAAASCPAEVRAACEKRAMDITTAIPTIVFEPRDGHGSELTGVTATMDGEPLTPRLDGTALAVDPGEHTFVFARAGGETAEKRIIIHEGEKDRREPIVIGTAPAVVLPAPPPGASLLGTRRVVGLGLGGAGVVGLGVATALGVVASSAWSRVKTACGPGGPTECNTTSPSTVTSDRSTAVTDGTASTVLFVLGGALIAGGAVVFLTAGLGGSGASVAVTPTLGPAEAGFSLRGTF